MSDPFGPPPPFEPERAPPPPFEPERAPAAPPPAAARPAPADPAAAPAGPAHREGDGWAAWLDPGERILWEGRPDGAFHVGIGNLVGTVFGLFFTGFSIFWMTMAAQAGGFFWMFGLIFFFVGLGVAGNALFGNTWKRRHSWYALSNRRAFIATDLPFVGRRLNSWPVTAETMIEFDEGERSSLWFARETRRRSKGGTYTVRHGFERIADGRAVLALLRRVQRGEG
jgi:hypothetical protein